MQIFFREYNAHVQLFQDLLTARFRLTTVRLEKAGTGLGLVHTRRSALLRRDAMRCHRGYGDAAVGPLRSRLAKGAA